MKVKQVMLNVLRAIWKFLKKAWPYLVGLVISCFAIKKGIQFWASLGKVEKPANFVPVPGKKGEILVYNPKRKDWVNRKLPNGYKSSDVKAAGFSEGSSEVKVEIKHEVVDRRSP